MSAIKILAIDNSPLFLHGLLACLRQMPLVAKADGCQNRHQLFEKLNTLQPQLVFAELSTSSTGPEGITICNEISSRYKNVFVAAICAESTAAVIKHAYQQGARAFFDKDVEPGTLQKFLNAFCRNAIEDYYTVVAQVPERRINTLNTAQKLLSVLTRREREVMELIVKGATHLEIEQELNVTYDTYKSHHARILKKMELKNDVALTRFALKHTLFAPETETQPELLMRSA